MSLAADARVVWGGHEAIAAITALPRREHCVEIIFGPKYSIGLIDRKRLEAGGEPLDATVAAFVRDVAIFDQRACSAPQTIFIERNAAAFARGNRRNVRPASAKAAAEAGAGRYTTTRIVNVRAEWALDPSRDVLASSDGANWTVCMDREIRSRRPCSRGRCS